MVGKQAPTDSAWWWVAQVFHYISQCNIVEIKYTINGIWLNYPQNIPLSPPWSVEKLSSTKLVPGARKWGTAALTHRPPLLCSPSYSLQCPWLPCCVSSTPQDLCTGCSPAWKVLSSTWMTQLSPLCHLSSVSQRGPLWTLILLKIAPSSFLSCLFKVLLISSRPLTIIYLFILLPEFFL